MKQSSINMIVIAGIVACALWMLLISSSMDRLAFKDLAVGSISPAMCQPYTDFIKENPEKAGYLLSSITKLIKSYKERGTADTCFICKNNADPRCKEDRIARWVFANCP